MYALLIFAVALAVRLIHVWQLRPSPFFDVLMGDAHGYDSWAQRLAGGDWIGTDVFYQAPLYPYFLGVVYAIFGRDLLVVRIIQAVIGSASCVLLGLAAARFFTPRVGMAAGLALALWAPAIFFDGLLQKSVLDVFFVCAMLWLISGIREPASGSRIFALGVIMGALALTRENALIFIGVIAIWFVRRSFDVPSMTVRRRFDDGSTTVQGGFEHLAAFLAGLLIVLLPVVARNYAVDGGFYLTTAQFGPNFYI
ncbi:MAG TPA: glycosyltransferase family 39 protein, partial [Vicinamibacterales bacterium]